VRQTVLCGLGADSSLISRLEPMAESAFAADAKLKKQQILLCWIFLY
jgi:hypothetical protein